MKVLLGVDLGTSNYKAAAVAADGRVLATNQLVTRYRRPAADRVQFSAPAHFQRLCRLIRGVVAELPASAEPAALCLSGANGNTLLLDAGHRPLAPAISWLDTRAGDDFQALLPALTREEVRETVGWPWTRRFPLTELAWIRRYRPSLYGKARYFVPDTAYYHHGLCGRLVIDHSSATTFFLQDQKRRCWHEPFLRTLGIEARSLAELVAPGTKLGGLTSKAARDTGLPAGLPVVAGSFDHPSAAIGSGVLDVGELLLSGGTSWVGFLPTRDRASALAHGLIVDPFRQPDGPWGAMFALTAVGTTIDRYLTAVFPFPKSLPLGERYRRFTVAAATVARGAEGTPIDPLAPPPIGRRAIRQLVAGSSLGQLSRRLMVGTALAMRRRLAAVTAAGFDPRRVVMVGGPSASAVWTQIVADVVGRELEVAGGSMAGATGAALLGGIGVGLYRDAADAVDRIRPTFTRVSPDPRARDGYAQLE